MLSENQYIVINVVYDLMEKAQKSDMDMIYKWSSLSRPKTNRLVTMLLQVGLIDWDDKHKGYFVSRRGLNAMKEYNIVHKGGIRSIHAELDDITAELVEVVEKLATNQPSQDDLNKRADELFRRANDLYKQLRDINE